MTNSCAAAVRDEAALEAALKDADIVPLALVEAHLSKKLDLLKEMAPYISGTWNFQEKIPAALKTRVRERLTATLKDCAAKGGNITLPEPAQLPDMMSYAVGGTVPKEYMPLIVEEMHLTGQDLRVVDWTKKPSDSALKAFKVIIVGAGVAGILTGIRLKRLGIPFEIIERDEDVGGTWLCNRYPGCAVDTPNHFYSFSFLLNHKWSRYFSKRDEILDYIQATADKFGLREHIRFQREVTQLQFDSARSVWKVTSKLANGESLTQECNVVISAVGQLSTPSKPAIPGLEKFEGPVFHTAEWRSDVDLKGKNVAVIGTGASAMQVAPAIVDEVGSLSIFQRTPHWINFNENYNREVSPGSRWALEHIPLYANWYRFMLFWGSADGIHSMLQMDPTWDKQDVSLNAENHAFRKILVDYAREKLEGNEDLLKKVIPNYPPFGKRMLRDNNWFKMLLRPNVDLVTSPIAEITPKALVTKDGASHPADVIVLSTGFTASKMLWPMDVVGVEGKTIRSVWGDDDPRAYMGMSAPDFPNLFILYGPNTNLAHGGSNIFHAECQSRYIALALCEMIEKGYSSLEVRRDVHDAFNEETDKRVAAMVWSHRGVTSYYKNKANRVFSVSPYRLLEYWKMTHDFNIGDFVAKR